MALGLVNRLREKVTDVFIASSNKTIGDGRPSLAMMHL